jgi:hypothetical protein
VQIELDIVHNMTRHYLDYKRPGVPASQVEASIWKKMETKFRHNWKQYRAVYDKYETIEENLIYHSLARARFHRRVRRKWILEQRNLVIEVSSDEEGTLCENTLYLTAIDTSFEPTSEIRSLRRSLLRPMVENIPAEVPIIEISSEDSDA